MPLSILSPKLEFSQDHIPSSATGSQLPWNYKEAACKHEKVVCGPN